MSCRFCEEYEWGRQYRRENPGGPELYTTYHACLCEKTHRKGHGLAGRYLHRARPLNFCPECGRPLRRRKGVKSQVHTSVTTCKMCTNYATISAPGGAHVGACTKMHPTTGSQDVLHECEDYNERGG